MSDIIVEKAKEIAERIFLANVSLAGDKPRGWSGKTLEHDIASAIVEAHASRDPEVAELRSKVDRCAENWNAVVDERAKLTAEIEKLKLDLALRGEGYDPAKTASVGRKLAEGFSAIEALKAEREASRKLVEAAKGLSYGVDWNNGTHAKTYRPMLLEALKFYATPGHSPEDATCKK